MDVQTTDRTYVANTYNRFPLTVVRGKGSTVWDEAGRAYTDLSTGIAVNTFGVADDAWLAAVTEQLATLPHMSNLYYTAPCAELAKLLCEKTGMSRVFFSNSGAEANECAIKVARRYAEAQRGKGAYTIVTLENSFHGRTITTLAATGQEVFHRDFTPLTEGFVHVRPGDLAGLEQVLTERDCAALMMEPVQGEGGVVPLDADFVRGAAELCAAHGTLLIFDEVQTGNGRSGRLYAYMHYGVTPDIVTTAKGLAGGLPLGATLLGARVRDVLTPGSHGSTFGGNPAACAGAVSILSRLDEATLAGVRERSDYIRARLTGAPGVLEVSGMGLMLGIRTARDAGDVIRDCMARGVLVIRAKERVRLLPALNIPMEQLAAAMDVLCAVCASDGKSEGE